MPIYEYACGDCGRKFEVLMRADTVPQCPECHSLKLEKQLSVFATTTAASPAAQPMPSPCQSCGNPDGPGACGFS